MKTQIPVGTIVKLRDRGEYRYARVIECHPKYQRGEDKFCIQYYGITEEEKKKAVKAVWTDMGMTLEQR